MTAPRRSSRVANPLSAKFDVLRPSLLPGLLDAVAHNRRHGRRDVRLFEIGARFTAGRANARRGDGVDRRGAPEHWSGGGRARWTSSTSRASIEQSATRSASTMRLTPAAVPFLVAARAAPVVASGDDRLASSVSWRLPTSNARGAPRQDQVFVAELDLDRLARARRPQRRARAAAAAISVGRSRSLDRRRRVLACRNHSWHHSGGRDGSRRRSRRSLFRSLSGQGRAGRMRSACRCGLTFQAADRTLTDADVQQSFDSFCGARAAQHGAVQR